MPATITADTKSEALEKANSLRNYVSNLNKRLKEKTEEVVDMAATIGGGGLAGYIEGYYPDKEFFGLNAGLVAGTAFTFVGMMGYAGKQSPAIASFGTGMLAYEAGRRIAKTVQPED